MRTNFGKMWAGWEVHALQLQHSEQKTYFKTQHDYSLSRLLEDIGAWTPIPALGGPHHRPEGLQKLAKQVEYLGCEGLLSVERMALDPTWTSAGLDCDWWIQHYVGLLKGSYASACHK